MHNVPKINTGNLAPNNYSDSLNRSYFNFIASEIVKMTRFGKIYKPGIRVTHVLNFFRCTKKFYPDSEKIGRAKWREVGRGRYDEALRNPQNEV